jgi:hypothetical protein
MRKIFPTITGSCLYGGPLIATLDAAGRTLTFGGQNVAWVAGNMLCPRPIRVEGIMALSPAQPATVTL